MRGLDAPPAYADASVDGGPNQAVADGGRADGPPEAGGERDSNASTDGDASSWTPVVASCPDRGGVPFQPEPAPAVAAASPFVSRLDQGDPTGTVVQLAGAAPSIVASSDGRLSLPPVPDGTYALGVTLGVWEETIPQLQMTGGRRSSSTDRPLRFRSPRSSFSARID